MIFGGGPQAFWLVRGMARAAGVPLTRAVVEGWITRDDLDGMVCRCAECGRTGDCREWLSQLHDQTVPEFCAVRNDIEGLASIA